VPGATIPGDGQGVVDWVNNTDNWREEDAEFIQGRTVIRWSNVSQRSASGGNALGEGSVSYVASTKGFQVNTTGDATGWSNILHSTQLVYTDTIGSNFQVRLSGGTTGLRFYTDGLFADTKLAVGNSNAAPKVKIDSSGITVNTDAANNPGLISTNNSGQVMISAANGLATNNLTVSGSASFSSAVNFAAAVTFGSTVNITNLNVGNAVTVGNGGLTSTGGVISALAFATQAPNAYQVGSTGFSRSSNAGALLSITNSTPTVSGNNVELATPSSGAPKITINGVSAPIAGYMTGNGPPGTTAAPDGTIWFQI